MIQGILAIVLLVLAAGLLLVGASSRRSRPFRRSGCYFRINRIPGTAGGQSNPLTPSTHSPNLPPPTALPLEREILFLRAPQGRPYSGYELLQCLLTCGLRFGENNIFHRYEHHPDGQVVLFSVAAATKNGELKPSDMGDFNCPGLSLFITLNNHVYPSVNFELMLDTARQLMEDLGGTLLDENQAPLIPEKIQQIREKIKRFETSQQTMELFV